MVGKTFISHLKEYFIGKYIFKNPFNFEITLDLTEELQK